MGTGEAIKRNVIIRLPVDAFDMLLSALQSFVDVEVSGRRAFPAGLRVIGTAARNVLSLGLFQRLWFPILDTGIEFVSLRMIVLQIWCTFC